MNKRSIKLNLFNWRNATLIGGSLIFIIASLIILVFQRNGKENIIYFENSYFVISAVFILFLIYSIFTILYPIFSAFPQEFIFCTYFFKRYKSLFIKEKNMIIMSSILFDKNLEFTWRVSDDCYYDKLGKSLVLIKLYLTDIY